MMGSHTVTNVRAHRQKKWMQHAVPASHKGRLHKALHIPEGQKIPEQRLEAAAHSKDPHIEHMAQMAERFKAARHK